MVDKLVVELGAAGTPRLEVFNKCDKLDGDILPHGEDIVSISARTGAGVDRLLAAIENRLGERVRRVTIHIPYDKGGVLDLLYQQARVERVDYAATIEVEALCPEKLLGRLGPMVEGWVPPKEDWED